MPQSTRRQESGDDQPIDRAAFWSEVERAETEGLTDDEVAAELRRCQWHVDRTDDGYRVSNPHFTPKGVRNFLGILRFLSRFYTDDEVLKRAGDEHAEVEATVAANGPWIDRFDGLSDSIRWASGVLDLMLEGTVLEEPDRNAISGAREHLRAAEQHADALVELWRESGR